MASTTASPTDVGRRPSGGCIMDSLYIKGNGEMSCWDDVGERILRRLDPESLAAGREADLVGTPELAELRVHQWIRFVHFEGAATLS